VEFQHLFVNEWKYQKGPAAVLLQLFPTLERQGNQIVRVIGSVPERFSLIYATLISAIVNPATNVYITDAYFAPVPTQNLERVEFELPGDFINGQQVIKKRQRVQK
jgi:cardiolipin synthase A/B